MIESSHQAALLEEESFERMRLRLRAVSDAAPPHFDPRALALRALVVADRLGQRELRSKVDALQHAGVCDPRRIDDLRMAARALLYVLGKRGAPVEMSDSPIVSAVRAEALEHKRAGIDALEKLDEDEARLWLDVVRLPADDLGLVFDLRSMALLYEDYAGALGEGIDATLIARTARRCADALEDHLMVAMRESEWNEWIDPAFTMTLSLYEEVCRIGRFLTTSDALGLTFPSTASIARAHRRRRNRTSSSDALRGPPPPAPVPEIEVEPRPEPEPEPALASVPVLAPAPGLAPAPRSSIPPDVPRSQRETIRRGIELEVSLVSESNFYVGFTENLSEGGVFVATYLVRPLGSLVEMSLRLPGRGEPLLLRGEVRWVRVYSPTSDAGPGMGIRFEAISETDRAEIADFLATREPLFFTE